MANHEACELYIEQQIEHGLEDGKTPYAIGQELSTWIAKLFEVKIPRKTLSKRAERKLATNVANQENQINTGSKDLIKQIKREPAKDGTMRGGPRPGSGRKPKPKDDPPTWTCTACGGTFPMKQKDCNCVPCQSKNKSKPKPNFVKPENNQQASSAMQFAVMAISQLERIQKDDPQRVGALLRVVEWINNHK